MGAQVTDLIALSKWFSILAVASQGLILLGLWYHRRCIGSIFLAIGGFLTPCYNYCCSAPLGLLADDGPRNLMSFEIDFNLLCKSEMRLPVIGDHYWAHLISYYNYRSIARNLHPNKYLHGTEFWAYMTPLILTNYISIPFE